MASKESFSEKDLFDEENLPAPKTVAADDSAIEEVDDTPLVMTELTELPDPVEEVRKEKEEARNRKKSDYEEVEAIKKEIEEHKEQLKERLKYKKESPRSLRAMFCLYQEHALLNRTPGIQCQQHPGVLLLPVIEHDGERELVILKSPVVGSLERYPILPNAEVIERVRLYYAECRDDLYS